MPVETCVRGQSVLVAMHRSSTSVAGDDGLVALLRYPSFVAFLARCGDSGHGPRAVAVRHLRLTGDRVVGLVADVNFAAARTETLSLADAGPVIVLPVATTETGARFPRSTTQRWACRRPWRPSAAS